MNTALLEGRKMTSASSSPSVPSVASREFRDAMAALAAPVTIVTCYDEDGTPRGLTASAVTSLSMDPPLVLVCLDRRSRTHDTLLAASSFCINLLAPGNEPLAAQFAGDPDRRFTGLELAAGPAPVLAASSLQVTCAHEAVRAGGDHSILIGRVTAVTGGGTDHAAGGLLWHQRGFAHAAPAAT